MVQNVGYCKACAKKHKDVIWSYKHLLTEKQLKLMENLKKEPK